MMTCTNQVWFKWRTNNQDIRLLDVTTNRPRPKQVATIQPQRGDEVEEADTHYEDAEGSASVTHEDEVAQKQRRGSPAVMIPGVGLVSPSSPCGLQTPSLASIPLSPVVTSVAASGASVAAMDQAAAAASLVVSSTPDTEVAAQLARPTPSYLCPYLPDLKASISKLYYFPLRWTTLRNTSSRLAPRRVLTRSPSLVGHSLPIQGTRLHSDT